MDLGIVDVLYSTCIYSHTKDSKNGRGCCLLGIQHEVRTTKHNWSVQCQYNVTGWDTMWACDRLFQ